MPTASAAIPDRIFVSGHSAGGHLTATTLQTDWDLYGLPHNIVKGAIAISGLFDLTPLACSFLQPALRLTGETIRAPQPAVQRRAQRRRRS